MSKKYIKELKAKLRVYQEEMAHQHNRQAAIQEIINHLDYEIEGLEREIEEQEEAD